MIPFKEYRDIPVGTWVKLYEEDQVPHKHGFFPVYGEIGKWVKITTNNQEQQNRKEDESAYQLYTSDDWYITRNLIEYVIYDHSNHTLDELMKIFPEYFI